MPQNFYIRLINNTIKPIEPIIYIYRVEVNNSIYRYFLSLKERQEDINFTPSLIEI